MGMTKGERLALEARQKQGLADPTDTALEPTPGTVRLETRPVLDPAELLERAKELEAAVVAGQDLVEASKPLATPDVTPAQARAFVVAVLGFAAAIGLPVEQEAQNAMLAASAVIPAVWVAADAVIRFGRAKYLAAKRG